MFTAIAVDATLASAIMSQVSDQFTDAGTLAVLALVAGIPLAFYVIRRLIGLIPKGK
jgi:hypothetical protein